MTVCNGSLLIRWMCGEYFGGLLMIRRNRFRITDRVGASAVLLLVASSHTSSAQSGTGQPYIFTGLEASSTACCTFPKGINDVGQVVGDYYVAPTGPNRSFIYKD